MKPSLLPAPPARPRFLSEAECHDIAQRLARYAKGGGESEVGIESRWTGNVRWARNRVSTSGEDRDNRIQVYRIIRGASGSVTINEVSDAALVAAARRAERLVNSDDEKFDDDLEARRGSPFHPQAEPADAVPALFVEATYQLDAGQRAAHARQLMQSAADAGMLSAGYIQVSATSTAYINTWGDTRYYQYTWAQYSVTVRDPKGVGSGWAGVDWPDWRKIDGVGLSALALDKCLKSRNPVAVEPGRYTTILEPQAVCDFVGRWGGQSSRDDQETGPGAFHLSGQGQPPKPYNSQGYTLGPGGLSPTNWSLGLSRLGEKVIDERISISSDPMDPELGFPNGAGQYHPATWVKEGVLTNLYYDRKYAVTLLGRNTGLPAQGAFRMSVTGPTTTIEEMIATTKRGLLVTRFDQVMGPIDVAMLCRGYTRDGLWLIENGKISKAVKNLMFVESILFALNNVEQLGVPQRAFRPGPSGEGAWGTDPRPVIVPPIKVRDFSFTALSDAV